MSDIRIPDITKHPEELKNLSYDEVEKLCARIREILINTTSENGGHLASNLGVVELTVALHRVFDAPVDQIVFDVGHQCYTHKLLTGRADRFSTLRQEGGIAGFPKPTESEYDPVISGHSSTSISTACGLARAKSMLGEPGSVVAVIGDGALTGGLAYEGLNTAGRCRDIIIVVLNDNKMSISKNVGAMARYLAVTRSQNSYIRMKRAIIKFCGKLPLIGKPLQRFFFQSKHAIKSAVYKHTQNTLFDALGFAYLGPVDGHNQKHLEQTLAVAKNLHRPALIHVCTIKGRGYDPAERSPGIFHGIGQFHVDTGEPKPSGETFSKVFGRVMCELAEENDKVYAITAAMKNGTGLDDFAEKYHRRFYDCGIAEGHAVTFSAGLAVNGLLPVFAVYSTFIQRAYDEIIHDVAIAGLNVTFAVDRAGVVGEDGETHHGVFDCSMLNSIPGLQIYSPCYFSELEQVLRLCVADPSPAVVRYPRGVEPYMPEGCTASSEPYTLYGDSEGEVLIVTYGRISAAAYKTCERLNAEGTKASVLKLCRVKPIDDDCSDIAKGFGHLYFFEEGIKQGGIGETYLALANERGFKGSCHISAIDNGFVEHATVERLLQKLGLDEDGMYRFIRGGGAK